jgi:hypothetical protein
VRLQFWVNIEMDVMAPAVIARERISGGLLVLSSRNYKFVHWSRPRAVPSMSSVQNNICVLYDFLLHADATKEG